MKEAVATVPGRAAGETGSAAVSKQLGAISRRPFLTAGVLLIVGVLCHRALPVVPRTWLALGAAGAVVAIGWNRRAVVSNLSLALAVVMTGLGAAQLARFGFAEDHIAAFAAEEPRLAEIELVLDQPPRVLSSSSVGGRALPPRQVTAGGVTRVRTWEGWRAASGRVLLSIDHPNTSLAYGQRVVALGTLSRPPPAMNPGQFDWSGYYRRDRVLASLDAPHAENVGIVEESAAAWPLRGLNRLCQAARSALAAGFSKEQSLDHSLLRALLLGDHDPELRDVQDDFRKTGTSHHLAISGMHVAILGGFVWGLCRLARLRPRVSAIVMMGFVVLYGLVALPSPPVIRSIVLCACFGVAMIFRRSVEGVQLLSLTVFAMLVLYPLDLYDAGFQLSFGTVLGLMTLATPLARRMNREDEDDRVLRLLGVAPGSSKSVRLWFRRHLTAALAAGLVAWAISAPLIVQHFDQLNPWAVVASILLAIPVFLSLLAGLLKVVLTLLLPWFAPTWASMAAMPVALMRHSVDWLAKLPASDVPLPALPVVAVVAFYGLFVLVVWPRARRSMGVLVKGGLVTACGAVVLLPLLTGPGAARDSARDQLRVTLLSVGAGQCAVVELPASGKTILIDAGSSTNLDLCRRCIEPFLRHRGIGSIDSIYISHANVDHFSAVSRAVGEYRVRQVALTQAFEGHARRNAAARQMLADARNAGAEVLTVAAGQTIRVDDSTRLEVLWPPAAGAAELTANDSSEVLRLTCAGHSILFTGDVQEGAIESLLRSPEVLRADVLVAPHHGSAEAATGALLEAVRATTVLASNDRTPTRKQREFDALIAGQHRTLLRTDRCGAITVRVGKDGVVRTETFLRR
jgi:competence protein ComEC